MALRPATPQYQHRGHRLMTGPAIEPVTPDELRAITKTDSATLGDSEANMLIHAARNYLEEITGIAFITQSWLLQLDHWPGHQEAWWDGVRDGHANLLLGGRAFPVKLPRYPLQSIVSIKTYDDANNEMTINVSDFFVVDTASYPGRMALRFGMTWPIATREIDAIRIEYQAGFGNGMGSIPPILRDAVLTLASYYHDHRGECDMREAAAKSGGLDMMRAYSSRGI